MLDSNRNMKLQIRRTRTSRALGAFTLAFVLATAFGNPARAATFPDLYAIVVSPSPDAEDPQAEGVRLAMGQLLTRLTGRRDAGWDADLSSLIEAAQSYVDAVGFETADRLLVRFNGRAVEQELTRLGRPIWGPERPLTLVWLAVDGQLGERAILGGEDALAFGESASMSEELERLRIEIESAAAERGLPITLPLLDLEDLNAIDFADIWGGFSERIVAASQRYHADALLVGKARVTEYGTVVDWTLLDGTRVRHVIGGAVRDGLDSLADLYAAEFATLGGTRTARITVTDVATAEDYGRLMKYLESLSVLEAVEVESLEQGAVTLRLAARGDTAVLERVLSLGGMLRPVAVSMAPMGQGLVFELGR